MPIAPHFHLLLLLEASSVFSIIYLSFVLKWVSFSQVHTPLTFLINDIYYKCEEINVVSTIKEKGRGIVPFLVPLSPPASVEPLADDMYNYTRYDRDNQCSHYPHNFTSFCLTEVRLCIHHKTALSCIQVGVYFTNATIGCQIESLNW